MRRIPCILWWIHFLHVWRKSPHVRVGGCRIWKPPKMKRSGPRFLKLPKEKSIHHWNVRIHREFTRILHIWWDSNSPNEGKSPHKENITSSPRIIVLCFHEHESNRRYHKKCNQVQKYIQEWIKSLVYDKETALWQVPWHIPWYRFHTVRYS